MTPLFDQRCSHHPAREAVVRCPACRRFFCRECATERDGRMMCAACALAPPPAPAVSSSRVTWIAAGAAGFLLAWLLFYNLGVLLARIPSDFFDSL